MFCTKGFQKGENHIYIIINNDGNPFTKNIRHDEANVNTQEENQNDQNNNNQIKDLMLKGHPPPQLN